MAVMVQPERAIRCPDCRACLGTRLGPAYGNLLAMRPETSDGRRQEIIAGQVVCIRCSCGGVWRPDPPDLSTGDIEYKGGR